MPPAKEGLEGTSLQTTAANIIIHYCSIYCNNNKQYDVNEQGNVLMHDFVHEFEQPAQLGLLRNPPPSQPPLHPPLLPRPPLIHLLPLLALPPHPPPPAAMRGRYPPGTAGSPPTPPTRAALVPAATCRQPHTAAPSTAASQPSVVRAGREINALRAFSRRWRATAVQSAARHGHKQTGINKVTMKCNLTSILSYQPGNHSLTEIE